MCNLQLPCDEYWKREELKAYLMQAPIGQWEGSPIQHMGQPGYISMIQIANTQKQVTTAHTHSGLGYLICFIVEFHTPDPVSFLLYKYANVAK